MPLVVKEVTAPAAEPVTLDEAKLQLRVDFTDDDTLITRLITAARRYCEVVGKVTLVNTTYDMVDDAFPFTGGVLNRQVREFYGQFTSGQGAVYPGVLALNAGVITLPRAPIVSVTSITYLDANGQTQTLDPSTYVVTTGAPGRIGVKYGSIWPVTLPQLGAVTIRFTAGYGPDATTVPANAKQAVLLYLTHLYAHRGDDDAGDPPKAVEALLGVEDSSGGYA